MKTLMFRCLTVLMSFAAIGLLAVPEVTVLSTTTADGVMTVNYHLSGAPAIITFDVEKNDVSIGDKTIYGKCAPQGDVSKMIVADGDYSIRWNAVAAMPGMADTETLRGVVYAWEPSDPPDYMVADLAETGRIRYYTSTNALPGGLLENDAYRTSKIVMRRVKAKNITWNMGTSALHHSVTLSSDYWFGIFPMTQGQIAILHNANDHTGLPCGFTCEGYWAKRIGDNITYHRARSKYDGTVLDATFYPAAPGSDSYLGRLRTKTGVNFDLPSEAQWEYACRAGMNDAEVWVNKWNDGTSGAENCPGRISTNGGLVDGTGAQTGSTALPDAGVPWAGMYAPNGWGIYDMHGGVMEWCLDWYEADISDLTSGEVNANGANAADGTTACTQRVTRGGCWFYGASQARTTMRNYSAPNDGGNVYGGGGRGFRVAAPIE